MRSWNCKLKPKDKYHNFKKWTLKMCDFRRQQLKEQKMIKWITSKVKFFTLEHSTWNWFFTHTSKENWQLILAKSLLDHFFRSNWPNFDLWNKLQIYTLWQKFNIVHCKWQNTFHAIKCRRWKLIWLFHFLYFLKLRKRKLESNSNIIWGH